MRQEHDGADGRMREIAQHLLSYEGPATRVFEALHSPLCTLVGVQGCRVLLARALTLARAKEPELNAATVQPDGSVAGLSEINKDDEAPAAGVELAAQVLGLLATFIGEGLTLQILRGVWPDLTIPGASSSGESEI